MTEESDQRGKQSKQAVVIKLLSAGVTLIGAVGTAVAGLEKTGVGSRYAWALFLIFMAPLAGIAVSVFKSRRQKTITAATVASLLGAGIVTAAWPSAHSQIAIPDPARITSLSSSATGSAPAPTASPTTNTPGPSPSTPTSSSAPDPFPPTGGPIFVLPTVSPTRVPTTTRTTGPAPKPPTQTTAAGSCTFMTNHINPGTSVTLHSHGHIDVYGPNAVYYTPAESLTTCGGIVQFYITPPHADQIYFRNAVITPQQATTDGECTGPTFNGFVTPSNQGEYLCSPAGETGLDLTLRISDTSNLDSQTDPTVTLTVLGVFSRS